MVDSGKITIIVTNQLLVLILFTLRLRNQSDNSQIGGDFVFTDIPSMGNQSQSVDDISGNLTNDWTYDIVDFSSSGSSGNNVPINLSDQILISLNSDYIVAFSGNAVLVDQVFFRESDILNLDLDLGQEVTYIEFLTGEVNYIFESQLNENARVNMELFIGEHGGNLLIYSIDVPANATINSGESLAGAGVDLSFDLSQPYNKVFFDFTVEIISSGVLVDFNLAHIFVREYWMGNMSVGYVEGYFGEEVFTIDNDSIDLDLGEITDKIQVHLPSLTLK